MAIVIAATGLLALQGCGPGGGSRGEASTGQAQVGGPFHMVDQDGKAVDQHLLDGKWSAVFFGYTYCPDVCPATLQVLAQAQARLGANAGAFQVVFVSIDPARDTPPQLKSYLAARGFPRQTTGLTGSAAQVAAIAKAYRVYYAKEGTGDGYAMAHSSIIYLMNPKGQFDSVLPDGQTPEQLAADIADAINKAAT